jgi:hypothetical protein
MRLDVLARNLNVLLFELYVAIYLSNASVVLSHSLVDSFSAVDDFCGICWWFCETS